MGVTVGRAHRHGVLVSLAACNVSVWLSLSQCYIPTCHLTCCSCTYMFTQLSTKGQRPWVVNDLVFCELNQTSRGMVPVVTTDLH